MAHTDIIKDSDKCFEIDPITRVIRNASPTKTTIIQFDHNSERFTFTLPRFIEGHDMMECTKAEVHYLNIASSGGGQSAGVYAMTDMAISAEDESMVTCSWLISQNATKHVGSLNFLIRFSCVAEDGTIEYVWNTEIFKGIMVSTGMYNSEAIVEQYADVLEQWKQELLAIGTITTDKIENGAVTPEKTSFFKRSKLRYKVENTLEAGKETLDIYIPSAVGYINYTSKKYLQESVLCHPAVMAFVLTSH